MKIPPLSLIQKLILWVSALLAVLCILYPKPAFWEKKETGWQRQKEDGTIRFIVNDYRRFVGDYDEQGWVRANDERMVTEALICLIAGLGLIVVLRDRGRSHSTWAPGVALFLATATVMNLLGLGLVVNEISTLNVKTILIRNGVSSLENGLSEVKAGLSTIEQEVNELGIAMAARE